MPFTPFHMGPGLLLKALMQGSFSLLIFGWTQVLMDLQPLLVILSGRGHLHGITHTYLAALPIALIAALSGKPLVEWVLRQLHPGDGLRQPLSWSVTLISAGIGSLSHVFLDSLMHIDLHPFYPINEENPLLGIISLSTLHNICIYSGLLGVALYYVILWRRRRRSTHRMQH